MYNQVCKFTKKTPAIGLIKQKPCHPIKKEPPNLTVQRSINFRIITYDIICWQNDACAS